MRLFLDTNVIISAMLFPNGRVAAFLRDAIENHTIVIGEYVIEELRTVFRRKFPERTADLEEFILEFSYETVQTPIRSETGVAPVLRDPKDNPILESAIRSNCDYLITGDKDLTELEGVKHPKIVNPGRFLDRQ